MNEINYIQIYNEYISTDVSINELANRYGIAERCLQERCNREKWVNAKKENNVKLREKIKKDVYEKELNELKVFQNTERLILLEKRDEIVNNINNLEEDSKNIDTYNKLLDALKKIQDMIYKSYGVTEKKDIHLKTEKVKRWDNLTNEESKKLEEIYNRINE